MEVMETTVTAEGQMVLQLILFKGGPCMLHVELFCGILLPIENIEQGQPRAKGKAFVTVL